MRCPVSFYYTLRTCPIVSAASFCATIVIGLLAAYLAVNLFALIGETHGELFALIFLLLYGRLIVAVVFGVIAALRQRLKEIEGGEEEDAKKY